MVGVGCIVVAGDVRNLGRLRRLRQRRSSGSVCDLALGTGRASGRDDLDAGHVIDGLGQVVVLDLDAASGQLGLGFQDLDLDTQNDLFVRGSLSILRNSTTLVAFGRQLGFPCCATAGRFDFEVLGEIGRDFRGSVASLVPELLIRIWKVVVPSTSRTRLGSLTSSSTTAMPMTSVCCSIHDFGRAVGGRLGEALVVTTSRHANLKGEFQLCVRVDQIDLPQQLPGRSVVIGVLGNLDQLAR